MPSLPETLAPSSETKLKKTKNIITSDKKAKKYKTTPEISSDKKIKKKRKASSDSDHDEAKSDTSSEILEPQVYCCFQLTVLMIDYVVISSNICTCSVWLRFYDYLSCQLIVVMKIDEPMKKSKKKKIKTVEVDVKEAVSKEDDPNSVSNFRISEPLKNALKAKGIEALFPIQARTFDSIFDGLDLIGKAKTGQVLDTTFEAKT